MEVAVALEHRFVRTPDGAVWTESFFARSFWQRYLGVFDGVRLIARVRDVPYAQDGWQRVDGAGVGVKAMPYYVGAAEYLRRRGEISRAARTAIPDDSAVILRVSSQIANCLQPALRRTGHPFAVEVVADPYGIFAPGAIRHPLRPLLRWWFPMRLRRQCRDACAAAYVTREMLQALPAGPAVNGLDYGQYYGYLDDASLVGAAALNPHDPYFGRMRPDSVKAPHGHFQHVAPADPGDDFPYSEFKDYEAKEMAAGKPPLLVTATFAGKKRPVLFSWTLELGASLRPTAAPAQWAQAVNLRDDRYIRFFIDKYVRGRLWRPAYTNYWVIVDNCSLRYHLYGVLDDDGVFHPGIAWDPPFAATEREFLDSKVYFLERLKQLAPDLRIMGNEGSLGDESDYPRIWAGFDGSVREDINVGFRGDARSRHEVFTFCRRYQYLAGAGKLAILRALLPNPDAPGFQQKLRTSYATYLLFRGRNFYYGPRFDDGTARGVDPSAYAEMRDRLGLPVAPAGDSAFDQEFQTLYSRECEGGVVFLNYSGAPRQVPLPEGYYDREGNPAATITIPDMQGGHAVRSPERRPARPRLSPVPSGPVSGLLRLTISPPAGATVHCTLDGSEPRADSPVCGAPWISNAARDCGRAVSLLECCPASPHRRISGSSATHRRHHSARRRATTRWSV